MATISATGPATAQTAPTATAPTSAASALPSASAASSPADRAKRDADVFHWILIHSDKPRKSNSTRDERLSATARSKPAPQTPSKPADEASVEVPTPSKTQTIATLDPKAVPAAIAADPVVERSTEKVTVKLALPQAIAPAEHDRSVRILPAPVASAGPDEPAVATPVTDRNVVLSKVEVEPTVIERADPTPASLVAAAPALSTSTPTPAPATAQPPSATSGQPIQELAVAKAPMDRSPASIESSNSPASGPSTEEGPDESGEEALKPLTRADPQFSAAMMRTLRKGKVEVRFTVMPDGSVSDATVLSTSNARLNSVALAAIGKWRFAPISKQRSGVVDMVFDLDAE